MEENLIEKNDNEGGCNTCNKEDILEEKRNDNEDGNISEITSEKADMSMDSADGYDNQNQGEDEFVTSMERNLNIKAMDPLSYSSLALAYIGDDVYDIIIRTLVMSRGNMNVNNMNKRASSLVKAETQSKMVKIMESFLTEEEMGVYKRGRNAKSVTTAKNASVNDYRRATGFEALMGYLYLKKRFDRLTELVKISLEGLGEI